MSVSAVENTSVIHENTASFTFEVYIVDAWESSHIVAVKKPRPIAVGHFPKRGEKMSVSAVENTSVIHENTASFTFEVYTRRSTAKAL